MTTKLNSTKKVQGTNDVKAILNNKRNDVVKNMKAVAEDVTAEEIHPSEQTQTAIGQTQETKPETIQKVEVQKMPTLEEIKNRATVLFMLQEKHTELLQKKTSLDRFEIKHDNNNATVTIKDSNGLMFTSSSPKTINQLLAFWKEEFNEGINKVETQLLEQIQFNAVA